MSRTLIGVTSYGNLPFLEMTLRSFQETITKPDVDVLVVVAQPNDTEMQEFLRVRGFKYLVHDQNKGFPASINDILDYAFVDGSYDYGIIAGNDIIACPGAIDTMIQQADDTNWQMFCASEFDVRFLYNNYPQIRHLFQGEGMVFTDFSQRPWEVHQDFRENTIQPDTLKDVRNLTLYKREVFDLVGYADVSYYKNGYYEDLDFARRCHLLGVKACGLPGAVFFHWWSRTIHQGEKREHSKFYLRNRDYYCHKWGGTEWGKEVYTRPYNNQPYSLGGIRLPNTLDIPDRDLEPALIKYWSTLR